MRAPVAETTLAGPASMTMGAGDNCEDDAGETAGRWRKKRKTRRQSRSPRILAAQLTVNTTAMMVEVKTEMALLLLIAETLRPLRDFGCGTGRTRETRADMACLRRSDFGLSPAVYLCLPPVEMEREMLC